MEYTLTAATYQNQDPQDALRILGIPEIENVLFPAKIAVAPGEHTPIESTRKLELSSIPREFHPDNGFVIPLESENGVRFRFTGFDSPTNIPSTVVIKFNKVHFEEGILSTQNLIAMLHSMVKIHQTEDAFVYDLLSGRRENAKRYIPLDEGRRHRLRIEWITYYSRELVRLIGRERFDQIGHLTRTIDFGNGILILLQEEPFNYLNPDHRRRQEEIEEVFGIQDF